MRCQKHSGDYADTVSVKGCLVCFAESVEQLKKDHTQLQAENGRYKKELREWLVCAESYDPNGPNSAARYGRAGAAIEKAGIIKRLKRILKENE